MKQHEVYQPSPLQVSLITSHSPPSTLSKPPVSNNLQVSKHQPCKRSALALQLPYTTRTPVTQLIDISDPISSRAVAALGNSEVPQASHQTRSDTVLAVQANPEELQKEAHSKNTASGRTQLQTVTSRGVGSHAFK